MMEVQAADCVELMGREDGAGGAEQTCKHRLSAATLFHGVFSVGCPGQERLKDQLRIRKRSFVYGDYTEDTHAALVYDYITRQLHDSYGERSRPRNSTQFLLECEDEKQQICTWLSGIYAELDVLRSKIRKKGFMNECSRSLKRQLQKDRLMYVVLVSKPGLNGVWCI